MYSSNHHSATSLEAMFSRGLGLVEVLHNAGCWH